MSERAHILYSEVLKYALSFEYVKSKKKILPAADLVGALADPLLRCYARSSREKKTN